jgi:TolB protein
MAAPVPAPDGPRLAFTAMTSLRASGLTVRMIGTESSRPLVLLRGSRSGVTPNPFGGVAWSADGSLLAFTGSKGKKRGIYAVRADGTGLRFLRGTKGGSNPVFSPDGRRIAFARDQLGKGPSFGTTPWVVRVDGSGAHRLADLRNGVEYVPSSFSPDGSVLAVTRTSLDSDRPNALFFELDGSGARRALTRFPASDPVFSPDGSQIALVRHSFLRRGEIESTHKDIYLVSASGANVRQLTRTRWIAETAPGWDPSGERVVFNSFRINRDPFEALFDELLPFGNSIVQVNADGSCREKLISLPDVAIYGVKWQPGQGREAGRIECGVEPATPRVPDGPRLALVKFDLPGFRFGLETIDEVGARRLPLAGGGEWRRPLPEWFTAPAWSPDGSMIAFAGVARRLDGNPRGTRLYVSQADGRYLRPLRGTHGADQPVFAPDGHTVAFTRYRFQPSSDRHGKERFVPRASSIWFVDLHGGVPRRITPARKGLYMYPASFSPDGDTLLATREVGRRPPEAVALALSTGGTRTVLRRAFDPIVSPDGSRIAVVRWRSLKRGNGDDLATTDIFTVKAGGGSLRRLTSGRKDDLFQSWDPSGERLSFVSYRPEVTDRDEIGIGSAVMQVNADGSCLRTVLKPSRVTAFYGAAWQPGPGREAGRIAC